MRRIFVLLAIVAFISGCSGDGGGPDIGAIHSGTEGIKMEFLENSPPPEIMAPFKNDDGYPFTLGIKLVNNGAVNVENGWMTLSLEEDYMKVDDFRRSFSLEGKSISNPVGESEIIIFNGITKKFKEGQSDKYKSTILATTCYKYKTEMKEDMCVDTDVLGLEKKKQPCKVSDITSSGQGAPVAVSKIEAKMIPEGNSDGIAFVRPQYIIHLKNAGDGEVMNPSLDPEPACSSDLIADKNSDAYKKAWNFASVSASLSGKELICAPNPVKLKDNDDTTVRCTTKEEDKIDANTPSYRSPLVILVDYGYTTTISTEVMLVRDVTY